MTDHRIPDGFGNDEAEPWTTEGGDFALFSGTVQRFGTIPQVHHNGGASRASAFPHRGAKLHG